MEYLKELGVGATWLSPMFKSPMYDFGYDISDFYDVHDEYGTMEDFDNLIAKANELGKDIKNMFCIMTSLTNNQSDINLYLNFFRYKSCTRFCTKPLK